MARLKRSSDKTKGGDNRLTEQDVARLLDQSLAPHNKLDVTAKLATNYISTGFSIKESDIAEQIFRMLARDTEVAVRVMLAEQLKSSVSLPHDIAFAMARDVAQEVALPMLRYSEVLTEEDLVVLVEETRQMTRHIAVGGREHVSERVSEALMAVGEPEVAETLMANKGALLSDRSLEMILTRFSGEVGIMRSLARRPKLPVGIAEKVVAHVSASLARDLRKKYRLEDTQLADTEVKTHKSATLALLKETHKHSYAEMERLVAQLVVFNRLTPELVFSALEEGYLVFFETAIARLAGIPTDSARRLLHDHGDLGFRAIYNQAKLPAERFAEAQKLLTGLIPPKADSA